MQDITIKIIIERLVHLTLLGLNTFAVEILSFLSGHSKSFCKKENKRAMVIVSSQDQHRDELPSRDKAEKEKVEPLDGLPSETALDSGSTNKTRYELLIELEAALMDKSNQCTETVSKLKTAVEEVTNLRREFDISQKLLDECQMNCAHLENCLHEAREEAYTNLCAADRRASEYSVLRTSAVKTRGLFERLRACVTAPGGVAGFANSLRALALSLASSANENEDDATADIRACIRDVAKECGSLPLAVVTLGRALRDKDRFVWSNASLQLRRSIPTNIEGMHSKVFLSLMLSYDNLEGDETKLLFLFCCLFPDDNNVSVNALRIYLMGEGLFQDLDTLEETSCRVYSLVDKLKASCLLLDGERERYVRMHDVVRDVAVSISSRDENGFMVNAGLRSLGFTEWRATEKLERCKRISLMSNRISTLLENSVCPQLQTLLLQNNACLEEIPDKFFEGMRSIAVLVLSRTPISSLPKSISCLSNLRTLCLNRCHLLSHMSLLGSLKKLEILSLKKSKIHEFPEEIGGLSNL
ncbi:hypothetical protein H6P81_007080 [Aristolochia fimbriata]|uniref:Uncharacterized protein n=1 Tax=Aristolochia fimbriata TaxID=158543 RepID=A0AAV7F0C3_ARIFI|nr:hypothetical protein H6P81_007080 [Aristolochia fimbriata]